MLFSKPKKKNPAPKIIAIVLGCLAAVAAAYVIFDKFLKNKLCRCKNTVDGCCEACGEDDGFEDNDADLDPIDTTEAGQAFDVNEGDVAVSDVAEAAEEA